MFPWQWLQSCSGKSWNLKRESPTLLKPMPLMRLCAIKMAACGLHVAKMHSKAKSLHMWDGKVEHQGRHNYSLVASFFLEGHSLCCTILQCNGSEAINRTLGKHKRTSWVPDAQLKGIICYSGPEKLQQYWIPKFSPLSGKAHLWPREFQGFDDQFR